MEYFWLDEDGDFERMTRFTRTMEECAGEKGYRAGKFTETLEREELGWWIVTRTYWYDGKKFTRKERLCGDRDEARDMADRYAKKWLMSTGGSEYDVLREKVENLGARVVAQYNDSVKAKDWSNRFEARLEKLENSVYGPKVERPWEHSTPPDARSTVRPDYGAEIPGRVTADEALDLWVETLKECCNGAGFVYADKGTGMAKAMELLVRAGRMTITVDNDGDFHGRFI